jgi:KDO2-lipid IV(A) lauroyltransferase
MVLRNMTETLGRRLRVDSEVWRRAVDWGVRHGPDAFVRYSPPMFGLAFWAALAGPRNHVRTTLQKLKGARPQPIEIADSARVFTNFAFCLTESLLLGAGRGYEPTVISANDGADFKTSRAHGKGVILATAHTAGWDVAGPMLMRLQSGEVVVVMQAEEDRAARQLHDAARRKAGVQVMHAGDDPLAALPLLNHLRKKNGIVAMKFDRTVPGMRCRNVTFLGQPWQVPAGIFQLAAVSGAPILPVFTRRLGFLRYEYITAPPLLIPRRPSESELDEAAQHLAGLLEDFARRNPEQWFRFTEL